jgi:hypothetical protein
MNTLSEHTQVIDAQQYREIFPLRLSLIQMEHFAVIDNKILVSKQRILAFD